MTSRLHESFRRQYARMPKDVQDRCRRAYRRFMIDPAHPSLEFKRVHPTFPLWSARVSDGYRVVGVRVSDDEVVWVFIGTHGQYERFIANH